MADFMGGGQSGQRGELIRVMGLWEGKDRNGAMMLEGTLAGRVKVQIVVNSRKQSDREPDYQLMLVQNERPQNQLGEEQPAPQAPEELPPPMRLAGLWRNTDRKGKTYLNGSLQSLRILIFSNNFHNSDRDPGYILYVCQSDRQGQGQGGSFGGQGAFSGGSQGGSSFGNAGSSSNTSDDDIPF